jgi:hypothetical protein
MGFIGHLLRCVMELAALTCTLVTNGLRFVALCTKSRAALMAENLFLRKQLACYPERRWCHDGLIMRRAIF